MYIYIKYTHIYSYGIPTMHTHLRHYIAYIQTYINIYINIIYTNIYPCGIPTMHTHLHHYIAYIQTYINIYIYINIIYTNIYPYGIPTRHTHTPTPLYILHINTYNYMNPHRRADGRGHHDGVRTLA